MIKYIVAGLFLCGGLLCKISAHSTPYTIRNIEVKKTSTSSADAKSVATKEAKRKAFFVLIKKLVTPEDFENLKETDDDSVEFLIDSVQTLNEQVTSKAYRAYFSFEFNKERVEAFLRDQSISFVSAPHKPILVLPVLSDGAKSYLFEQENTWFSLWKKHTFNNAILTFIVPYGDLQDMRLLNAEDALIGATNKLKLLIEKYHPDTIIVPYVSFVKDGGELNAYLTFQEFDDQGIKKTSTIKPFHVAERAAEASKVKILGGLLDNAISGIQRLHRVSVEEGVFHHTIYLRMETPSAKVYYQYIKLLENSSMVREVRPLELSKGSSLLEVKTFFAGEKLISYFGKRGYQFELADQDDLPDYLKQADKDSE